VDDRLRDLGALAFPAGTVPQRAGVGRVQADPVHGDPRRLDRVRQPDQPSGGLDEPGRALVVEQRLLLRGQADPAVHLGVTAGVLAEQADGAARRPGEAADQPQQGRLAGAVGPEQRRDARAEAERDVGDGDDLAVPAADADQLGDRLLRGCLLGGRSGRGGGGGCSAGAHRDTFVVA
jgi:hypothetical protein